jgi:bifunctional non-homologous end joining protein LigD
MLASAGAIRGSAEEYSFEPKLDGWRAVVSIAGGRVSVRTRHGNDVTVTVPELSDLPQALPGRSLVLDGELVAHRGTPSSFYRLSGRMAARRPTVLDEARRRTPLTFVAFDALWVEGDVTAEPYHRRRELLEQLELAGPGWCTVSAFPGAGAELFAACTALGLEGLVAKKLDSRYEPGVRSKTWVKAKCSDWLTVHASHRHG